MQGESHPRELEDDAHFRAYLFGPARMYQGERALPSGWIARRRAWDILVWFLLNPGKPAMPEALAEQLWPDDDLERIAGSFHVSLHALRRALEPGLGSREDSAFIRRHSTKIYSFDAAGKWWTDVFDLEQAHRRGHESELDGDVSCARFYYRRVGSYVAQGKLLEGDDRAWVQPYRRKFSQVCQQSLNRLMTLDAQEGSAYELIESAYLALKLDPYNTQATRIIIESSIQSGRRPAAAQRLRAYCKSLVEDLGVSIPDEIAELARRVKAA